MNNSNDALPFAKMLIEEERTDMWGVTYGSYEESR